MTEYFIFLLKGWLIIFFVLVTWITGLYMMFAWDTKGIGAARRILATFIFSTQVLTLLYLIVYRVIA